MRISILPSVCAVVFIASASGYSRMATLQPGTLEIGLLLVAIDAQPDHIRVSEGMRVGNPGPPVTSQVRFTLPPGAVHATFHTGFDASRETAGGFAARVRFPTGVRELAYSYALPAARDLTLTRTFPFRARRIEIVVRGAGTALEVRGGTPLAPLRLGGQEFLRWERLDVPAGSPVAMTLRGLPVTRRWVPAAAAGALAVVLTVGLAMYLRRRPVGASSGRGLAGDGKNFRT